MMAKSSKLWACAQKLMNKGYPRAQAFAIAYDEIRHGKAYIATPVQPDFWTQLRGLGKSYPKPGISIVKGADGLRLMYIVTSNSYQDRDDEYITTKALAHYVERSWPVADKCITNNVHMFWHGGDPIGDIIWADMEGPFLVEVSKERTNRAISLSPRRKTTVKKVWDYIEENPDGIEWGASHGFRGAKDADRTFHWIDKFETSTLPLVNAANPITYSGVVKMSARDDLLDKITGKSGLSQALRKGIAQVGKTLDKAGIQHKETTANVEAVVKGLIDDVGTEVDTLLANLMETPPEGLKDAIVQLVLGKMADTAEATDQTDTSEEPGVVSEAPPEFVGESKALHTLLDNLVTTQKGLLEDQTALRKAIEALQPLNQLGEVFKAYENRQSNVESQLKILSGLLAGRPRAASQDASTLVTDPKKLTEAKKAAEPLPRFWADLVGDAKKG